MKILHLTDTHIGNHLSVQGAPDNWVRGDDHALAMARALQPALDGQVDLVVHSGDVFNRSRPSVRAMQQASALLIRAARRVPVVLIPGNHDRWGLARSLPRGARGLHVCDGPERLTFGPVALALVPFQRRADAWARAARQAVGGGVDLLVAHQAFDGARVPGLTFRVGQQPDTLGEQHLPSGVRHILCGHIHPRQVTQVGAAAVVQPGSTERTSFSEAEETKGYALWELGRELTWSFQDLPSRPMRTLRHPRDLADLPPQALVRLRGVVSRSQALQAGAWVAGRDYRPPAARQPASQLALFSRRRGSPERSQSA
jgi:DNA repair exonuclease SbcCD nuclease subunit